MASKKIIAAALVCAVTAVSAGVITTVGAAGKQEVSDSGKTVSVAAAGTGSRSETKQEQQNAVKTASKTINAISDDLTEPDLPLTEEQEKQIEKLCNEQEEIVNAHKELWDKVYDAEAQALNQYIDENLTVVSDGKEVDHSLISLDDDTDDVKTYAWNGDSYEAVDGSIFTLGNDLDEADTDDDLTFQNYAVTLDGDTDEEKIYVWNSDGYGENGDIFVLPEDWNGTDDQLWEEEIIKNLDDLTEEEKNLLLDDLKKIYEINDQILAVYQQTESI